MPLSILDNNNVLNVGTVANDNTGDNLRTAGQKINANFEALDSAVAGIESLPEATVTNSTIRYDGVDYASTDGLKVDASGNTTVAGTLDVAGPTTFADSASFSTNVNLSDGARLQLGDSAEFQIFHTSGGNSVISETGSANLDIRANQLNVLNANGTETMLTAQPDNAVTLYYNGNTKVATTDSGVSVVGNITVTGDVDGRNIGSDGNKLDGIEANATADQTAQEIMSLIQTLDSNNSGLNAATLDGINSTSFLRSDTADIKTSGNLRFNNDVKATFGTTNDDLQIYHDGSNSYIDDGAGTGSLILKSNNYSFRNAADTEQIMTATQDSSVALYHNNVKKFETTSAGAAVTGDLAVTGNITGTISGVAAYERIGAAYASITSGTDIFDGADHWPGYDGKAANLLGGFTWDTVVQNDGGLNLTTSNTLRELFDVGSLPLDDHYIVKIALRAKCSNSDIIPGVLLFGMNMTTSWENSTTDKDYILTQVVPGQHLHYRTKNAIQMEHQVFQFTQQAIFRIIKKHYKVVNNGGNDITDQANIAFLNLNLTTISDNNNDFPDDQHGTSGIFEFGNATTSWAMTGGNPANIAIEIFRLTSSSRVSGLTDLPTTM